MSKHNTNTTGKLANGFTKEQAQEALPLGPFAGGNPETDPDAGITEVLGVGVPAPFDWGEGAGANNESRVTVDGGAISGGNCCAPGHRG